MEMAVISEFLLATRKQKICNQISWIYCLRNLLLFTSQEFTVIYRLRNLLLFTVSGIYHLPSQEFNICNVPATIRCLLNFTSFLKSHCIRFGTKSWQSWAYFSPWPAWKKIIKFLAFSCNCKKKILIFVYFLTETTHVKWLKSNFSYQFHFSSISTQFTF